MTSTSYTGGLRHRVRPLRTRSRTAAGARYAKWMASPAWRARRREWVREETARAGGVWCALCSQPWRPDAGDLHHLSYRRLGHERHEELMAMCRPCHEALHRVIDASPAWQRLIAKGHRAAVTRTIIRQLRAARGVDDE